MKKDPVMLAEYDFSSGLCGKYAAAFAEGSNVVVLDPDIAEFFPDHESVNRSLRSLVSIARRQQLKTVATRRRTENTAA